MILAVAPGVLLLRLLVSNLVAQAQRSTSSSAKFGPSQLSHDLNVLHVIEKLLYVRVGKETLDIQEVNIVVYVVAYSQTDWFSSRRKRSESTVTQNPVIKKNSSSNLPDQHQHNA